MKNTNNFVKIVFISLALCLLAGTFATAAFAANAEFAAQNLLEGVDFDDYSGSTAAEAQEYIYSNTGIWFTGQKNDTFASYVSILNESAGDCAINITAAPVFVNGDKDSSFNAEKYAKSSDFLDLFYSTDGPKKFTFSFDMTIKGESGTNSNIGATSDSSSTSKLYSYYRGTSVITFYGIKWLFKATSANLPVYVKNSDGTYTVGEAPKEGDALWNKGYLYPDTTSSKTYITEVFDEDTTETSGKYWGKYGLGYVTSESNKSYSGTGSCISPTYMNSADAITYTLNEPFRVTMDCTKSGSTLQIVTYIGEDKISTVNVSIGTDDAKKYGIRFFDATNDTTIDNLKLEISDVHEGVWAQTTTQMSDVIDASTGKKAGISIVEKCDVCNEVLYEVYPNVILSPEDLGQISIYTFIDVKDYQQLLLDGDSDPFVISFKIGVDALPTDYGDSGKSLLTWMPNGGFKQLLRLFNGGEIRMINSSEGYTASDSSFRLVNGGEYVFDIVVDTVTGTYDIYIDKEYFGSETHSTLKAGTTYDTLFIRFDDYNAGTYTVTDIVISESVKPEDHEHTFDKEIANEKYLKSAASCTEKALYYKSCLCGTAGTETFEYGDYYHVYDQRTVSETFLKSPADCYSVAVYYVSCKCGAVGTETFEYGEIYHVYDQSVTTETYLKSAATCKAKAVYYKSCKCGVVGTETFEYGDVGNHSYVIEEPIYKKLKTVATCTSKAVYYKSCKSCGAVGEETFEYGDPLPHTYDMEVVEESCLASAATSTSYAVYYKSCVCGAVGTETFETAPKIYLDYAEGVAGDTLKVNVNIAYNPGIIAAYLEIDFDDTRLSLVSAENGNILGDHIFGDDFSNGYRLTWDESQNENNTSNGVLATLEFKVLDNAELGDATVNVSVTDAGIIDTDLNRVNFVTEANKIKVLNSSAFTAITDDEVYINNNITVFEFKASFVPQALENTKYYPLLTLERTGASLDLLYVEASTGEVAIRTADGEYEKLLLDLGDVVLGAEAASMAVIYDDVKGLVRYYVGENVPYYACGESVSLANDVAVYHSDFCTINENATASFIKSTMEDVAVNISLSDFYNINESGTAEIVAFQENDITRGVRVLSGVDMPWYGLIGYEVETFIDNTSHGKYDVSSHDIFVSVIADDKTVYPSKFGYRYFSALAINEVKAEEGKTYYIILTPFTQVGDTKHYGEAVKIDVTSSGYSFDATYGTPDPEITQ